MQLGNELITALQPYEEQLGELAESAQKRDTVAFGGKFINIVSALASSIPIVGKLAEVGVREVFERSSYGQMQKAMAELDLELSEAERNQRIAHAVAQCIGQGLAGLSEEHAQIVEGLIHLDKRFEKLQHAVSEAIRRGGKRIDVHQKTVSGGATGVRFASESERSVSISQEMITGEGTTGVEL